MHVAYENFFFVQSVNCQILPESAGGEESRVLGKLRLPGGIVASRIGINGLFRPAVNGQVRLLVS